MSARFAKPIMSAICLALLLPASVFAQNNNNNPAGNNFFGSAVGGVKIDASGVLSEAKDQVDSSVRQRLQQALRSEALSGSAADMRMVSLKGLEQAIAQSANDGKPLPMDVRFLAGLQKIEYVMAAPESGDIILAGPAEPLTVNERGDVVGAESGNPALRLEDLIVALRSVDNARTGDGISVSINPTAQGVKNMQRMFAQIRQFNPAMQPAVEEAMGNQVITLTGVPEDSRFSHVLVAADYKMKRISMGLDPAPIKEFPSLLEMAQQAKASRMKAAPRFWMECDYQPLAKSADGLVWQIRDSGVKTLTEEDRYTESGEAVATGKQNRLAKQWAEMMTKRYSELAKAEPVFRELQNLMDMSVVAAIIRKHQFGENVGLELPNLTGATQTVSLTNGPAPKTVPTRCTFVRVTNSWLVTTSGGVQLDSWGVLESPVVDDQLAQVGKLAVTGANQWYWDAVN